jgi:serine/threonine protein kinase
MRRRGCSCTLRPTQQPTRALAPHPHPLARSTKFKVIKEIGSGSFSRVYRATHRLSGLDYALKRTRTPLARDSERNRWLQARAGGCTRGGRERWRRLCLSFHPHMRALMRAPVPNIRNIRPVCVCVCVGGVRLGACVCVCACARACRGCSMAPRLRRHGPRGRHRPCGRHGRCGRARLHVRTVVVPMVGARPLRCRLLVGGGHVCAGAGPRLPAVPKGPPAAPRAPAYRPPSALAPPVPGPAQEVQAHAVVGAHPNIVQYYDAWAEPDMQVRGWGGPGRGRLAGDAARVGRRARAAAVEGCAW